MMGHDGPWSRIMGRIMGHGDASMVLGSHLFSPVGSVVLDEAL